MAKIMVYAFTVPDDLSEDGVAHRRKATRDVIERLPDAVLIENSAEEVEESALDQNGYFRGPHSPSG